MLNILLFYPQDGHVYLLKEVTLKDIYESVNISFSVCFFRQMVYENHQCTSMEKRPLFPLSMSIKIKEFLWVVSA
jgi:hypothetical protein